MEAGPARWMLVVGMATLGLAAPPASAQSPGPPLEDPVAALEAALECTPDVDTAPKTPVLLVHGTWSDPQESWSWSYGRVLPQLGYPTCTVALPERALVDHQRSVEYVVHAVRHIAARSGRSVAVLGHSQGAVHGVYALRFWPDLADKIEDFVGLAGLYRGTQAADTLCRLRCPPANWQQRRDSQFTAAINRPPNPPGASYTSIYTQFDLVATPSTEVAPLAGASNVLIQDLCPLRPVDHIGLLGDAVAYRLVIDALTHEGPADPERAAINCFESSMPGADLAQTPIALATFELAVAQTPFYPGNTDREPPLRCYLQPGARCETTGAGAVYSAVRCDGRRATVIGTRGDDKLRGSAGKDVVVGLTGDDRIAGLGGRDHLCGHRGRDRLVGGSGRDTLRGGRGADKLRGGKGRDRCSGGKGRDAARGCEAATVRRP